LTLLRVDIDFHEENMNEKCGKYEELTGIFTTYRKELLGFAEKKKANQKEKKKLRSGIWKMQI